MRCDDCGGDDGHEVQYMPSTPLTEVNTQLALMTDWALVWRQYRISGWQLVVVRVDTAGLVEG